VGGGGWGGLHRGVGEWGSGVGFGGVGVGFSVSFFRAFFLIPLLKYCFP